MKDFLLPYPWKFAGIFLGLCGIVLATFYLWFDFRFTFPVFAVYSSFLETKMFTTFSTNFADDLILLLLLTGFGLIVFTKERVESEYLDSIRHKAMVKALISNTVFLWLSVLLVYGSGFVAVLVLNLLSLSIFYLFFFYIAKIKNLGKFKTKADIENRQG